MTDPALNNKDIELKFLNELSSPPHVHFIGYATTINIAYYGALFFLHDNSFKPVYFIDTSKTQLFITLLIILIDTIVYTIFRREHHLKDIMQSLKNTIYNTNSRNNILNDDEISEIRNLCEPKNIQISECLKKAHNILENRDSYNIGVTFYSINVLVSIFCTIPYIYLIIHMGKIMRIDFITTMVLIICFIAIFSIYFFKLAYFIFISPNIWYQSMKRTWK